MNPVKKKLSDINKESDTAGSGIKNLSVLIVEDDEISSIHLTELLKVAVKKIGTAKNGQEALDACRKDKSIDLILMDIKMPVMDGIVATKMIREFNKDVIIIAQTAFAFEEDRQNALAAGCNDFISKPIKKDKLIKLINRYYQ